MGVIQEFENFDKEDSRGEIKQIHPIFYMYLC